MAKARQVRITTYMKNTARSLGYSLGDVLGDYNPIIKSIAQSTKETASEIYDNVKSISFSKSAINENEFLREGKSGVYAVWNNFKDDLKTGNFYNKQRMEEADNALMKSLGFDMDFDLDDDWGDISLGDEDDSSDLGSLMVSENEKSTKQIVGSMDMVGGKVAGAISTATAESAMYITESANRSSKALYSLNSRGFQSINSSIGALNDTIGSFAQIVSPLTTHIQNSSVFFSKTTESLGKIEKSLETIVKNTTPAEVNGSNNNRSRSNNTYSDIFDYEGTFSFSSYKDMITSQFKDNKELVDMALGFAKKSPDLLKNFSPMKFITNYVVDGLMPKMFKDSMKTINESIKYSFSTAMIKARDKSFNNIFINLFKDMFLPQDGMKTSINTGGYNKKAIAWDGISRKALIEVIPTTLLKIYSAVSGTPEMRYDYNTGKFVKVTAIKERIQNNLNMYADSAGGDFKRDATRAIDNNEGLSKEQKEQLNKEISNYFYNAFMEGGTKFAEIDKKEFEDRKANYGLTDDSLKILRDVLEEYKSSKDLSKKFAKSKFVSSVQKQRDSYGNSMRDAEISGDNIQNQLYNNSIDTRKPNGKLAEIVDEYGHSSLFYLQGIYEYTGYLADNIAYIGGKSSRRNKRKRLKKGNRIEDIATETINIKASTGGEKTIDEANADNIFDDHSYNEDDFLSEDEKKEKERQEKMKEAKTEAKGKWGKIKQWFKDHLSIRGMKNTYEKPFNAVSGFINKISFSLDRILWGDTDDPSKGIFSTIFDTTKKKMKEFADWMDDKFKIKDKWNKFKDWVKDKTKEFRDETKDNLKKAGHSVFDPVKNFFRKGKAPAGTEGQTEPIVTGYDTVEYPITIANNGTAARGRKVTRSGIVTVSKGELIIPSEFNPFYHGNTDKRQQIRNEKRITSRFFGNRAEGGTVGEGEENSSTDKSSSSSETEDGPGRKFIKDSFGSLKDGAAEFFGKIFGATNDRIEKDKKIIGNVSKKVLGEMGENKGAMGAGALIGAGASVLTGAVVGPVFGAGIGAAIGLVANSKTIQETLFGPVDENGEVQGGLINKEMSQFITKSVPSIGKGAALGMVGGAFLGSPILGAILGGTVGYVSSSSKAKDYLFGKVGEDGERSGGLIPKALQQKIKKAAPNIGAGMLVGAALGPFGIVGNLIVGGSMGYLTTSEKFHNYMFGDGKDDKGLTGLIKTQITDNLVNVFHNLGNSLKGWGKHLFNVSGKIVKGIFNKIKTAAEEHTDPDSKLGKLVRGGTKLLDGGLKGGIKKIGSGIKNINKHIVTSNLKHGFAVYDPKTKKNVYLKDFENLEALQKETGIQVIETNSDYVKSVDRFKEYILGPDDKPKTIPRKILKALPNIGAGMLLGAAFGPVGIAGNLILGGTLGFASSSERFHVWLFGDKKGKKGVAEEFKEKILDNLSGIFHNMGNTLKAWGKNLIRTSSNAIKVGVNKAFGFGKGVVSKLIKGAKDKTEKAKGPVGRFVNRALGVADAGINGGISAVGDRLFNINKKMTSFNLKRGYDVYDSEQGRNLFASERLDKASEYGIEGKNKGLDQLLSQVTSVEDLDLLQKQLKEVKKGGSNAANIINAFKEKGIDISSVGSLGAAMDAVKYERKNSKFSPEEQDRKETKDWRKRVLDIFVSVDNNLADLTGNTTVDNKKVNGASTEEKKEEETQNQEQQTTVKDFREKIIDELNQIYSKLSGEDSNGSNNGTNPEEENREEEQNNDESSDNNSTSPSKDALNKNDKKMQESSYIKNFVNNDIKKNEDSEEVITKTDFLGNVHQYTKNNQGELTEVVNDSETKESKEKINKLTESINSIPLLSTGISGLGSLFGKKDKDKDDDEDKKGILGSILDFLSGDKDGPLKFVTNILSGGKIGSALKALKGLGGPALFALAFSGALDGFGKIFGQAKMFKGNDPSSHGGFDNAKDRYITNENGEKIVVKTDEKGNAVLDENGNYLDASGNTIENSKGKKSTVIGKNDSVSANTRRNVLNGLMTGKKSLGTLAKNTVKKVGEKLSKINPDSKLGKLFTSSASEIAKATANGIMSSISTLLEKIPAIIKKIPFLPNKVKDGAELIVTALYSHIDDAVKKVGKKASSLITKVGGILDDLAWPIKIAWCAGKGINAWGNAESILGITENASLGQKVIATLVTVVNALIPFIGDLIPPKVLVNIFVFVAPALGIDVSSLQEQREKAQKEVDEYNKANGTDLSIEEYNQMNGKAGIFTKAWNGLKSFFGGKKKNKKPENNNSAGGKSGLYNDKGNINKSQIKKIAEKESKNYYNPFLDPLYIPDQDASGGASGINKFVSQVDPKYADMRLGSSTVGEKGCGPAVATMISNDFGIRMNMKDAVKSAQSYQDKNGTKVGYFNKILDKAGLDTSQLSGKNIPKQVLESIQRGREVILLGRDKNNNSKMRSPFGPNPHYVIASGVDKNGNIIIKDPEMNTARAYNPSILKSATSGTNVAGSGGDTNMDIANQSGNGDFIGKHVRKYESGTKGPAAISSGKGDHGGVSFGSYQLISGGKKEVSKDANLYRFWSKYFGDQYPGINPGNNDAFKQAWLDAVNKNPDLFFNKEHEFIANDYYKPVSAKLASNGVGNPDEYDRAAQEAAWSTSVMYGPTSAANLFKAAGINNSMSPNEYISKLYDYKIATVPQKFVSSSGNVQRSIINRFKEEKNLLLGITGSPIDPLSTNGVSIPSDGGSYPADSNNAPDKSSGGILSAISAAFGKIFGKLLGTDSGSSTGVSGSNGGSDSIGTFAVGEGNEIQKKLTEKMLSVKDKLTYSMTGVRDPDKGSADCSSTVQWAYKKVTGKDIGGDTDSILHSSNTETIDLANLSKTTGGDNSVGPNISKLMPGDIMLYSRPTKGYSSGRDYRVGHVEMYLGNGQRIGHGGGMGPIVTSADGDKNRYIMAKRLIGITDAANSDTSSTQNNTDLNTETATTIDTNTDNTAATITTESGSGSGLMPLGFNKEFNKVLHTNNSKVRDTLLNSKNLRVISPEYIKSEVFEKTGKEIKKKKEEPASSTEQNNTNTGNGVSPDLVSELLRSIIALLESISNNTTSVSSIYQVLSEYLGNKSISSTAQTEALNKIVSNTAQSVALNKIATNNAQQAAAADEQVDENIVNLVGTLAAIAKG